MIRKISTKKTWNDIALQNDTQKTLDDVIKWLEQNKLIIQSTILNNNENLSLKLWFYGSSKTLKKTVASLIGKQAKIDVYRIDLLQVVSKYIGETEKNLKNLFSKGQDKNWILFFDEADVLFGKRTNVSNAHDRYSNKGIVFLQKGIENFQSLIILSSKVKPDADAALLYYIHSIIYFE